MHRLESVTCPVKIGIHKNHPINSKVLPILFSMPKKSFIVEILFSGHFSHRLTMPPNIIYIFKCLCESNSKYHPKHVKGFDPATNMTDTASPTFVNVNIYLRWWNDLLSTLYLNAFKSELLDLWTFHFSTSCKVSPAGRSTTSTTTRWSSPCRSLSGRSGTIQDWGDDPINTVITMAMIDIKNMIDTQVRLCWRKDEIPHNDRSKKGLIIEFSFCQQQLFFIIIIYYFWKFIFVIAGCDVFVAIIAVVIIIVVVIVVVKATLYRCVCCCFLV